MAQSNAICVFRKPSPALFVELDALSWHDCMRQYQPLKYLTNEGRVSQ